MTKTSRLRARAFARGAVVVVALVACGSDVRAAGPEPANIACDADVAAAAARILATQRDGVGDVATLPADTDGLKALLTAMRRGDQDIRFLLVGLMGRCGMRPDADALRPVLSAGRAIDERNRDRLGRILRQRGRPVISVYGHDADQSAFLVAEHADRDPAFQKDVLAILERELRSGETSGENYALLFDRVRVAEGKPQRYGSQGECHGRDWVPRGIESPKTVDRRRRSVGLEPLAAYRRKLAVLFCTGGG